MSTPKPILDNVVLRVMAFAHPNGLNILLQALAATCLYIPPEVYNRDESTLPINQRDINLSEFARGLRYATRQIQILPMPQARRYQTWLEHAAQVTQHLDHGSLQIQTLTLAELDERDIIQNTHQIGRGESACIVLAERHNLQAVFLSSDTKACRVAQSSGIDYLTLLDILERWIKQVHPSFEEFETLIIGMQSAKFSLKEAELSKLRKLLGQG
jgi:predicted nucleic acid-binding protein